MNGKSGNINNVCSQLYPPGTRVPGSELICVFDADQVASKEFFMKTIPMFDGGKLLLVTWCCPFCLAPCHTVDLLQSLICLPPQRSILCRHLLDLSNMSFQTLSAL